MYIWIIFINIIAVNILKRGILFFKKWFMQQHCTDCYSHEHFLCLKESTCYLSKQVLCVQNKILKKDFFKIKNYKLNFKRNWKKLLN